MKKTTLSIAIATALLPMSEFSSAAAFDACPTQAFLIQTPSNKPITYGVDLSTGSYVTLSPDMQTTKVNGVGFNYHDNYMYGWDYEAGTLAKIGDDFATQPLNVTSGLIGQQFYVGDVAVDENKWYGYRPGHGFFSIDLTDSEGELTMVKVATHIEMGKPKLTDFAFHPSDGFLYAVDNDGYLLKINPANGATNVITEVLNEAASGFNFTFGAQYFDVNGNLYISNNGNGYIYKVDMNEAEPEAQFFAYGPISQSNDGARCALAPVINTTGLDFGDAPDSYSTSFDSSGPRHGTSSLFLGTKLDAEADAYVYPLSDDSSDGNDDDDGVNFVTGIELAETAIIQVEASEGEGYLNAWIDWNQDGDFDSDEQILSDEALDAGNNVVSFDVPSWATAGNTWARFRISSLAGIGPTGGVSDGEVEDYPVVVTESNVTVNYYPSASGFTTVAYEDLWPLEGDFDMNDLLMNLRIAEYIKNGEIIRVEITGKVAAVGAGFNNGFAIQLPGVARDSIRESAIKFTLNGELQSQSVLEEDMENAVLMVTEDAWSITNPGDGDCKFFRTEAGCGSELRPTWNLVVPMNAPIATGQFPQVPYDPFIFAKPGVEHGGVVSSVVGGVPGRAWEVHLKNHAPTEKMNRFLLGHTDDYSDPAAGVYFQNSDGMAFALEVPEDWKHPVEKTDIRLAYPKFTNFAISSGDEDSDWYTEENAEPTLIFQD